MIKIFWNYMKYNYMKTVLIYIRFFVQFVFLNDNTFYVCKLLLLLLEVTRIYFQKKNTLTDFGEPTIFQNSKNRFRILLFPHSLRLNAKQIL